MNHNLTTLWPTILYRSTVEDKQLLTDLSTWILQDARAGSGEFTELARQTIRDELAQNNPLFVKAESVVRSHLDTYIKSAYDVDSANYQLVSFYQIHRPNSHDCVDYHNHQFSAFTGVLYVQAEGGDLKLFDPRGNFNRGNLYEIHEAKVFDPVVLKPRTGDVVIFPSAVPPQGNTEYVTVSSVDVRFRRKHSVNIIPLL